MHLCHRNIKVVDFSLNCSMIIEEPGVIAHEIKVCCMLIVVKHLVNLIFFVCVVEVLLFIFFTFHSLHPTPLMISSSVPLLGILLIMSIEIYPSCCIFGWSSEHHWDVLLEWYKDETHIGYDFAGKKIKKERLDKLDPILARTGDANRWWVGESLLFCLEFDSTRFRLRRFWEIVVVLVSKHKTLQAIRLVQLLFTLQVSIGWMVYASGFSSYAAFWLLKKQEA